VLAHLVITNPEYKDFYSAQSGHLILDNGAAEGELINDPQTLLDLAKEIGADEITAPDVLGDMQQTIDLLRYYVSYASTRTHAKTLVVMQCRTWEEFDTIYGVAQSYADSVALPKVMCEYLGPFARLEAAERIRKHFGDRHVAIHCFGCTDWMREAVYLARQGIVRGIDSASPIVNALYGKSCWDKAERRPKWYFESGIDSSDVHHIKGNMYEFGRWCNEEEAPVS